jgi:hypothetical protein
MHTRKPRQHRPTIVTEKDEREFVETLAARDESAATALERFYAQDEWFRYWQSEAPPDCQRLQCVPPFV